MDSTPARSLAGAARRSRRLQGTPSGHTGSATTASGSPYARPTLKRDSSSQTLAALESGGSGARSSRDVTQLDRRKSAAGTEGIFGKVRRGLGWLVGRSSEPTMEEESDQGAQESRQQDDEESMLTGSTRPRPRALPATAPRESSNLARGPSSSVAKRDYGNTPSVLSGDVDGDESSKKLRTSHSTLNLPRRSSPPKSVRKPHSSAGALQNRALSPGRPLPPRFGLPESQSSTSTQAKASIFASGPSGTQIHGHLNGQSAASRGSVSPGGMSQYALASQPTSGTSSAFGLQSQSPFRIGGHTARSPDLAALNISSGLARSPSLPAERLLSLQRRGPRLYPYQRSPSILSGYARPSALTTSYSVNSSLATGSKRDFGAMSMSPPKVSPGPHTYYRATPSGLNASPTNTDFGSDFSHRSKRQRVTWNPEKGFITTDADGNPLRDGAPAPVVPKNEAERILERLENIRRPQVDGLRSSSPRRLNVPLPTSTPGKGSIFATRISTSRTEPTLAGYAISPYARRQQAYREERAVRRDIINSRGGLGEHLRVANMEPDYASSQDPNDDVSEQGDRPRSVIEHVSNIDDEEEIRLPTPVRRRTRQRTREHSVLSDTSVQQDDGMSSLRRSTRIRKKPMTDEAQSPVRQPKSAKSPPPVEDKRSSGNKKKQEAKEVEQEVQSEADMEDDGPGRTSSPRRPKSPIRNNGSGSRAASPPPVTRNATIAQVLSPQESREGQSGSISSNLQAPKPSAREQRLGNLQGRKTKGFSAKDEIEEDLTEPGITAKQPKLNLPNSVFANRFSFGRSPSSSLLASPSIKSPSTEALSGPAAAAISEVTGKQATQPLPKLALPTSTPTVASITHSTSTPAFNFSTTAVTSQTKDNTGGQITGPLASTSNDAPAASHMPPPAVSSKPLFAFKAPEQATSIVTSAKEHSPNTTAVTSTKPTFAFGSASGTSAASAEVTEKPAAPFSFGQSSSKRKPEEPAPSFSFGKPAVSPAAETTPVIDLTKPSNPFAAFPTTATPSSDSSKDASKANPFAFGGPSSTASPTSGAAFAAASSASVPTFSFGGASSATTSFGQSKPNQGAGMSSNSSAAGTGDKPSSAPFSPVVEANKAPSFSFGKPASTSSAVAPAAQTPSFAFGSQAASQSEAKSRSASPFAVGAPAQPFSFGNNNKEDGKQSSTTSLSFGAPVTTVKETDKPASGGFTFGATSPAASSATTPAFSFGTTKPAATNPFAATAPSMQPSGSAFGSAAPQPSPGFGQLATNGGASTPSFSFGAQPNGLQSSNPTPSFSFGANSNPAPSSTPAFSFGGSSNFAAPAQPFAFGGSSTAASPAAGAAVPSFNFSAGGVPGSQVASPVGTPTGAGPPGGSFFAVGAGDPTSPNKARRPVKPLRRPR